MALAKRYDMIIYHGGCPDGIAAAWCFWRYNRSIETVPMTHGQTPPNLKGRRVVVLDFSFKRSVLVKLKAEAELFEVKDHHRSAQLDLQGLDYCEFDMTRSGCDLAWEFIESSKPKPRFLQAISDHDLWKKIPDSEAICRALQQRRWLTFEKMDYLFENHKVEVELLIEGRKLLADDQLLISDAVKYSRRYKMGEYTVRVATTIPRLRSEVGHQMCLVGDCDFSATWQYCLEKDEYWVSLRGIDKVDLSVVAAALPNGGGHSNAAAFTVYGRESPLRKGEGMTLRSYFKPLL